MAGDIFVECSICGRRLQEWEEYYDSENDDVVYCKECWNGLPEPDIKEN